MTMHEKYGCIGCRAFVVLVGLLIVSCTARKGEDAPVQRLTRPMMGTLVEVVWRNGDPAPGTSARVRAITDHMQGLADRMTSYGDDSEVSRINMAAGREPVKVSEDVLEVIEKSLEISRLTQGAFDVTVAPVEAAWGDIQRGGGDGRLPRKDEIRKALSTVGYRGVRVNQREKTVFLEKKGARLDLGGIAKGYIVDQGMKQLETLGLSCFMINAGGDIRASVDEKGPPWKIGLQDPFERGRLLGVFRVRQGAVVTSGTYERYRDTEQGRLSHILDPRTGLPVKGLVSVTVLSEEAVFADALATALMVMGRKKGFDLLQRLDSVQGVFVETDGTFWVEEGLKAMFEPQVLPAGFTLRFYRITPDSLASGSRQGNPEAR